MSTAAATITTANQLKSSAFRASNSYYRGSTDPVQIEITFTNSLILTDFVEIEFTAQSYTVTGSLSCIQATCTHSVSGSTTTVKMLPSSTQVLSSTIMFTIIGLLSDSATLYGQEVPVKARAAAVVNGVSEEIEKG